jgi:TrmH family RNA methyltransferase
MQAEQEIERRYEDLINYSMNNWKQNVYFMLVEPSEAGNIGASARGIKNMGFRNLCLVKPPPEMPKEAGWFAHNAEDILDSAAVYDSIEEALRDKTVVVGTTRRRGKNRGIIIPAPKAAAKIRDIAAKNKVAILFGRESRGLYNNEVEECGFMITIPSSKMQPSLNLSQAVMIISYELSKCGEASDYAQSGSRRKRFDNSILPKNLEAHGDIAPLYERISSVLELLEYGQRGDRNIMKKSIANFKRFLGRSGLTEYELNMLMGLCSRIEKKLGK